MHNNGILIHWKIVLSRWKETGGINIPYTSFNLTNSIHTVASATLSCSPSV